MNDFLLECLGRIESLMDGIHAYAYENGWLEIAVDDYDFYCNNQNFKTLKEEIRKDFAEKYGKRVLFIYRPYSDNVVKKFKKNNITVIQK